MSIALKLFFVIALSCCHLAQANDGSIIASNVPQYDPEASKLIKFAVTRRHEDGALKKDLLMMLKSTFDVQTFVESGTCLGLTALQAASVFDEVHTVELSPDYFDKAVELLGDLKNVFVCLGDSAYLFAKILDGLQSGILFYLDGHNSGGNTAKGATNTPIMQELASIRAANISEGIILIDDIRCFQRSCYPEKICDTHLDGYPDLEQLVSAILDVNPNYQICFLGDALLAYPRNDSVGISQVMHACTVHRLASCFPGFSEEVLRQADATIANAGPEECQELITYYTTYASWEMEMGLQSFSTLWYGLIVYKEGEMETAHSLFQDAVNNSLPGWRATEIIPRVVAGSLF